MDLIMIGVFLVLTFIAYFLAPTSMVMGLLTIILFISIPGYLLVLIVPQIARLPAIERFATSVTTSAALGTIVYSLMYLTTPKVVFSSVGLIMAIISTALYVVYLLHEGKDRTCREPQTRGILKHLNEDLRTRGKKEKIAILIALILIATVVTGALYGALQVEKERFSEFYITSESGGAYDIPTNYTANASTPIVIGIANHEGRTVKYFVEVWLVNYTFINNEVNVHEMYYYDSFNVTLENVNVDLNDPWHPQFETNYELNFSKSGDYSLMFLLFPDVQEELPQPLPLDHNTNYAFTSASWRIVECVNHQVQYLRLAIIINP